MEYMDHIDFRDREPPLLPTPKEKPMDDFKRVMLVPAIKKWANENYEKSYGASCIIECMSDEEIAELGSVAAAKEHAALLDEQESNCW